MVWMQKTKDIARKCQMCNALFFSKTHGGTKQFCSYSCSTKKKWETRQRKVMPVLQCRQCGKSYQKNPRFSLVQWRQSKFCSQQCSSESQRIKDGMGKAERYRRKKGRLKKGTPDWLERIRTTTKDAMQKPEIKIKLHNPKPPLSLERRIQISNNLMGKMPKNLMFGAGQYPNIQRGDYDINGKEFYFRSKWEANYALYLDFLIKDKQIRSWEYEKDVFIFDKIQFGTRSYRPDFKVLNNDSSVEYHEVKGYMDSKSKTKLKRMARYYPDVKLILIDKEFYGELKKKLGKVLNFY